MLEVTLNIYNQKRHFDKTPEPIAGESDTDKLQFVVQKHHASHLHYDFRLEVRGVLKSWAIPKGPSMKPKENRLAQEVEDHPFDYKDFEGIIPEGNYGAGTVIIWDSGWYGPSEIVGEKGEQEKWILHHYYKGEILIQLNGEKLKGLFQLKRKKERGDNAWILTKRKDEFSMEEDVLNQDRSILSGLTIDEMAENTNAAEWISNRASKKGSSTKKHEDKSVVSPETLGEIANHPEKVKPMLATAIKKPFNKEGWIYELKLDGYRIIGHWYQNKLTLHSRKLLNYTKYYPSLIDEFKKIKHEVLVDGEIVSINDEGKPDFDLLQKSGGFIQYYIFDILWINGYDITSFPLSSRKKLIKKILPDSDILKFSASFTDGVALFNTVKQQGLEGIVAKKADSTYAPGMRSKSWLKLNTEIVRDFVVGAWTESESGNAFRSLIFGNFENGLFKYVGHVGGGFKDKAREQILNKLKTLEVKTSPFSTDVETETTPHWTEPEVVITVRFATYTKKGNIRKPSTFIRIREDKAATEVTPEEVLPVKEVEEELDTKEGKDGQHPTFKLQQGSNWPKIDEERVISEGVLNIEGHQVKVTNIEKSLWEGITKASLLQYYGSISPYILTHLKNRPLSLHIKNAGPSASGFYIKDMEGRQPDFAEVFSVERKHKKRVSVM